MTRDKLAFNYLWNWNFYFQHLMARLCPAINDSRLVGSVHQTFLPHLKITVMIIRYRFALGNIQFM